MKYLVLVVILLFFFACAGCTSPAGKPPAGSENDRATAGTALSTQVPATTGPLAAQPETPPGNASSGSGQGGGPSATGIAPGTSTPATPAHANATPSGTIITPATSPSISSTPPSPPPVSIVIPVPPVLPATTLVLPSVPAPATPSPAATASLPTPVPPVSTLGTPLNPRRSRSPLPPRPRFPPRYHQRRGRHSGRDCLLAPRIYKTPGSLTLSRAHDY